MVYEKQTWTDNESVLSAERLNHIEDGIYDASIIDDDSVSFSNLKNPVALKILNNTTLAAEALLWTKILGASPDANGGFGYNKENSIEINLSGDDYQQLLTSDASSGQKVIPVADTSDIASGDQVTIQDNNHKERGIVDFVTADTSITIKNNLTYTYEAAEMAVVSRSLLGVVTGKIDTVAEQAGNPQYSGLTSQTNAHCCCYGPTKERIYFAYRATDNKQYFRVLTLNTPGVPSDGGTLSAALDCGGSYKSESYAISVSPDETKAIVFTLNTSDNLSYTYTVTMTTPGSTSGASKGSSKTISGTGKLCAGDVSPDGYTLIGYDFDNDKIVQYPLSNSWDAYSMGTKETYEIDLTPYIDTFSGRSCRWSENGDYISVTGKNASSEAILVQFSLGTEYDIDNETYEQTVSIHISGEDQSGFDIVGTELNNGLLIGMSGKELFQQDVTFIGATAVDFDLRYDLITHGDKSIISVMMKYSATNPLSDLNMSVAFFDSGNDEIYEDLIEQTDFTHPDGGYTYVWFIGEVDTPADTVTLLINPIKANASDEFVIYDIYGGVA